MNALIPVRVMAASLLAVLCVRAQQMERPVGLVLSANGGKLLRAGTELPLTARDGDVLYSGDGIVSGARPMTALYCPESVSVRLEPNGQLRAEGERLRVMSGRVGERTPVSACLLPELERVPAASQHHYGESFTRALKLREKGERPKLDVERLPAEKRAAFQAELARIDQLITADAKDKAARVARAALLEQYGFDEEALEEYRLIGGEWPDATWVGSRIFVHAKKAGRAAPPSVVSPAEGAAYAVLVGISKYQRLPQQQWLRYAREDAELFEQHLRSPRGGMLPAANLLVLTDEKATTAAIRNAFETSLKARAGKNDTVILFIAAHGVVESTGRRGAYIITHDSDPEDLASTALPMADVQALIREDLSRVGHVLVYVDVCRAGNIGAMRGANTVNRAVEEIAETEGDLFVFLASGPKELSYEGPQYGGGHGAFSYFLLEGLNGAADINKDQNVGVGEIIEYVREKVIQATNNRQHPRDLGSMDHMVTVAELKREGLVVVSSASAPGGLMQTRGSGAAAAERGGEQEERATRDLDEAIRAGRILPDKPQNAFAALRGLQRQLNPEEFLLAQNRLRVALENKGQEVLLRYLAGEQQPQTRADFLGGAAYFESAKVLTPESLFLEGRAAFCQGRALLFEKQFERAVELLERAARIDPGGAYSYNGLGIAYLERADYSNALLAFRDAARTAPNWAYPLHNMALAHTQMGDYQAAIRDYQRAIALAPQYSYLHYNLGLTYQRLNRRKEAEAAYRRALALAPESGEPYNALGYLNASYGRFEDAEKLYRQAMEKAPQLAAARHNLAVLLASRAGRVKEAHALWREVLAQDPTQMASRLSLARSLASLGDRDAAIAEYREVLKQKPDYVAARLALAGLLAGAGQAEEAVEELAQALRVQPENSAIHEQLGDVETGRGRRDEGMAAYARALGFAAESGDRKRIRSKMRRRP
jgi:tetratricopeptide (TPR) repeat protein